MKIIREKTFAPVYMTAGDTFTAVVYLANGEKRSISEEITEDRTIDTIIVFEADEMLGLNNCIGAVFGNSEQNGV